MYVSDIQLSSNMLQIDYVIVATILLLMYVFQLLHSYVDV